LRFRRIDLKESRRHGEIIEVCETACMIEPFEEELHLHLLDALIEEGNTSQAKAHYEYVTSMFCRELGVKPSPEMREIYRRIKQHYSDVESDLSSLQERMRQAQETAGVFLCAPDVFCFLYELEQRRAERVGQSIFLSLLTLKRTNAERLTPQSINESMETIKEVLLTSLRKGDVACRWNDTQYLLLLAGLSMERRNGCSNV